MKYESVDHMKDDLNTLIDDMETARGEMHSIIERFARVIQRNPVEDMEGFEGPRPMMDDALAKWEQCIQDMFGYYDGIRESE